ncbi:hypothetical protein [Brevibacillus daliensis]|uniref:hypothetical protein n=1 Tax=Brevibacillus daliensis TaxID=2892995 RepID=UPI001E375014|nr:hypothetical protein [Brevibacillus daliensis]
MEQPSVRLDQYVRELLEKQSQEEEKEDLENQINLRLGKGISSPASELPSSELKMLQQYIHGHNLFLLGEALPNRKKEMVLRKFFKHKRNQQVEVYSKNGEKVLHTIGKVSVVGRNFVILTTFIDRIWIPFSAIHSANIPYGLPDIPNTHQHLAIDKELVRKLSTQFGETVANRDVLIQQFFEETLETNMQTWKGTKVKISMNGEIIIGKVVNSKKGILTITSFGKQLALPLTEISDIRTLRIYSLFARLLTGKSKRDAAT